MNQTSENVQQHPLLLSHVLKTSASLQGIGVHSGQTVNIHIRPAPLGTGIKIARSDLHNDEVTARWNTVVDTRNNTTIANQDGIKVSTIEHLMAALAARSVDDAHIILDGPEMPIMDGSAVPFLELLDQTGIEATSIPRRIIRVLKTITIEGDDGRKAQIAPAEAPSIKVDFSFHGRVNLPDQTLTFHPLTESFDQLIAPARTFGLLEDAERIKAMGLALGASLDNTVVFDKDGAINPKGTRFNDECVRHKILDVMGDFHLARGLVIGQYHGTHTGHTLNNQLLRKLLADPSAFEIQ